MTDLLILGTDTDAGKTTLAALWLSAFADRYEYWKPVETGPSDRECIARLVPAATTHLPVARFAAPVAPPLAARREGRAVPSASALAAAQPPPTQAGRRLLIETFGSPFSPLNDAELQLALVERLRVPAVLVSSSTLGAIGRTLQCLAGLAVHGIEPRAVILVGPPDDYAASALEQHGGGRVFALQPPATWDAAGLRASALAQHDVLAELARLLDEPQPGQAAAENWLKRDRQWVWHPYTALEGAEPPLLCRGAHDEFLELHDGRRVIDGISSWWTILHGHRQPALMRAWRRAAAEIDHVQFAGVTHRWGIELAETLLRSVGWDAGRVFYSDNGSTAVEVALKMAYQFWCQRGEPQRRRFVGFEHGYHGDTFGAMAVSRDPVFFGRFEPLLFQADIVPLDPDRLDAHLQIHKHETAALILEPLVQGAGGMRMHSAATLRALAEVARRHGVLFIADEVMTGGGRTGQRWAHHAAGITPDLVCAAKTLTGGLLPLAATLASPHVVAAFETADRRRTFFHGHSFTGHPLACAVALASAKLAPELHAPQAMQRFWQAALTPLRELRGVQDVRVCGSIAAVELDVPGGYLADAGRRLRAAALEHNVLLRPLGSVVYAMPPFCTSPSSLQTIAEALDAAVRAALA